MKTEELRKIAETMREAGAPESHVLEVVLAAATVKEPADLKGWQKSSLAEFKKQVMA